MEIMKNEQFKALTKFGYYSSFAYWKSWNCVGDISFLIESNAVDFKTDYVFVALNPAEHPNVNSVLFKNFHSDYAKQNDFKLCYALSGTKFWGSYITDLFKSFVLTRSEKLGDMLKKNPNLVEKDIKSLRYELEILGDKSILIAIGGDAERYLKKFFPDRKIVRITHYADNYHKNSASKEKYRELILGQLSKI